MKHLDKISGIAIEILKSKFLLEYDINNNESLYYKYDDESKMINDFIKFYNEDVIPSWWCDGVHKLMLKTKIEVYEFLEYDTH